MRRRIATPSIALTLSAFSLLASSPALAQDEPTPEPVSTEIQEIGLLFNQTATSGTLRPLEGKDPDRYVLTLNDPGRQVIWFQDRPGRQSGHLPLAGFIEAWDGFGFADDPPNAALSVLSAADHEDTAILTLGRPRYDAAKRKLRYPVQAEEEATGNLAHFEHDHGPGAVERFGHAALFIDDAKAPVSGGCVIQPFARCAGADLTGADLRHADLTYADLSGADLHHADLTGAVLFHADLTGADLFDANLSSADLSSAELETAILIHANLTGAKMFRADLLRADLHWADLSGADLSSANLLGANLTDAEIFHTKFCNTRMPNGSINSLGCP